ncbi:MAG: hypothetical protein JO218_14620 [Burkholderiales bacterium]|nr:hypothetical protein [Burkholderiales bacterium]
MDFQSLKDGYPRDPDYPARVFELAALQRVLDGTMYALLPHPFHEERNGAGEYVPLARRRPSARSRICRTVVDDAVSLLFSEGHFPAIDCADAVTREALETVVREARLNEVMMAAAAAGAVGSVAIWLRVLKGRVFCSVLPTLYLTPQWLADAPDVLASVTERYKVKGAALRAMGYAIDADDDGRDFWFQRVWDARAERWFAPWPVDDAKAGPVEDAARTVAHGLGFVPIVWIRNLPGGNGVDGEPTMPVEAIDCQIEIDYQLSQAGRGLRYSSDPTLLIKEPAFGDGPVVKGAANALVVSAEGDAKLLEINGTAVSAVLDYVRTLRELALEGAHGNRAHADRISAAQSGRAMELMNQALIWLADRLRISYGEGAYLTLLNMIVAAAQRCALVDRKGRALPRMDADAALGLRWPAWYAPTCADELSEAQALSTLHGAGLLSRSAAVAVLAPAYGVGDVELELARLVDE